MAIDYLWGEFCIEPCPLDLSLGNCSHGCLYCFANARTPGREQPVESVVKLITEVDERETLIAKLMRDGYPVIVSNRIDPFAKNQARTFVPLIELMASQGIQMLIQTKGGDEGAIDQVLSCLPPSCWYVTITTLSDEISRRIEPGAPLPSARLRLVEKLTAAGHKVQIGCNPYAPEWCPDPFEYAKAIKDVGCVGVWFQFLHLNSEIVGHLPESKRQLIQFDWTKGRNVPPEQQRLFEIAKNAVRAEGIPVFTGDQSEPSGFFDSYRETYPHTFPVTQDFINFCWEHVEDGAILTFEDFWNVLQYSNADRGVEFPEGGWPIGGMIYVNYHVPYGIKAKARRPRATYQQVCEFGWREIKAKYSPLRSHCFAYAAVKTGKGYEQLVDPQGMPYLTFSRKGFPEKYGHCEV